MDIKKGQPCDPTTVSTGDSLTAQVIAGDGLPEDMSDMVFKQCQFQHVSFTGCELQDSQFEQCIFINCDFASVQFRQVQFRNC